MWIRWLEWRTSDASGSFTATRPAHGRPPRDGASDATDTQQVLKHFAEIATAASGEFVIEIVGATEADYKELTAVIGAATGGGGADIAAYLVARQVPGTAGRYADDEEGNMRQERWYQTARLCRLLPPVDGDELPLLHVIEARAVAQAEFLVLNWMPPAGYPVRLRPERVRAARASFATHGGGLRWPPNLRPPEVSPGDAEADEVTAFEWGPHEGSLPPPARLEEPVGATPSAAERLAENLVADAAESLGVAAEECREAIHTWEAEFLTSSREPVATRETFRHLGSVANLIGAIRRWNDELNSPSSDQPPAWFAATADSERALTALEATERRLDEARDEYNSALSVAAGIATSRQLELQSLNQAQGEAFQRTVALAGSIVLVPGLVATFYGANVPVPAGGTWWGTALVAVLMVVAGWTTWIVLKRTRGG